MPIESGTIIATVSGGAAIGPSGQPNFPATSTDNTVTVNVTTYGAWAYSVGDGSLGAPASTLYYPSTPVVGDVALVFLTNTNGALGPTLTDFGSPVLTGDRGAIYTRLCNGSETLTGISVVCGGTARHCSIIILVSGLAGLTVRGSATVGVNSPPSDILYPTITPSAAPTLVFYSFHDSVSTNVLPSPASNPGGTNPTPALLVDSGPIFVTSNLTRCIIWSGLCSSTSALGNRTVPNYGTGNNFYHGMTFAIDSTPA